MALRWIFLLLLMPLLAAQELQDTDPNISGEPQETGKKFSLLFPQEKVSLPSWCKVAVYLYCTQGAVALSERTGADVHIRAQDTWASVGLRWGKALFGDGGQQTPVCWESLCRGRIIPLWSGQRPSEHEVAVALRRVYRCRVLTTVEVGAGAQQRLGESGVQETLGGRSYDVLGFLFNGLPWCWKAKAPPGLCWPLPTQAAHSHPSSHLVGICRLLQVSDILRLSDLPGGW